MERRKAREKTTRAGEVAEGERGGGGRHGFQCFSAPLASGWYWAYEARSLPARDNHSQTFP